MRGTVKFFNAQKGWGFIWYSKGKDIFVHHSNIIMDGFRTLNEDDIVDFEIGTGNDGRMQAVSVTPILTMRMIENALKEKNLQIVIDPNVRNNRKYAVINENEDIHTGEEGMTFLELAAYAGFDVSELN